MTKESKQRFVKLKYDGLHYVGEGEDKTLAQVLGMRNKAVFECIALHQNQHCQSDLTFQQIADLLGTTKTTVGTAIKELKEVSYEGRPVILVEKVGRGRKERHVYTIQYNPLVSVWNESLGQKIDTKEESMVQNFDTKQESLGIKFDTSKETVIKRNKELKEEDEEMREMSPKEVITHFVEGMEKQSKEYKVVWGRDMKLAKAFLKTVEDLTNNDKKKVIDAVVENYDKWSTNTAKFPLQVSTLKIEWIQSKAREEIKKEKAEVSQIEEQSVEASKRNDQAISSIMSRIKNKGGQ